MTAGVRHPYLTTNEIKTKTKTKKLGHPSKEKHTLEKYYHQAFQQHHMVEENGLVYVSYSRKENVNHDLRPASDPELFLGKLMEYELRICKNPIGLNLHWKFL
jgi:hypothetical protein